MADDPIPTPEEPVVEPSSEVSAESTAVAEPTAEVAAEPVTTEPAPVDDVPSQPEPAPVPVPRATSASVDLSKENSLKAAALRKQKIEAHLEKILEQVRQKKQITNRDVVKLVRISDATASRYLKMLVERSQLIKNGRGRSVTYKVQM